MRKSRRIGVVVPSYEVSQWLRDVVRGIPSTVDHIAIVDDGSTDTTSAVAAELAGQDARITVLRHEKNGGVGAAMKTGYGALLDLGCDVMVKLDGDGQMDPGQIERLINPLLDGWADYTKGNRLSSRADCSTMPAVRLMGSILLTFLTKTASGYWQMLDPQNGYVAITREMLEGIDLDRLDDGYFFENSMLIALNTAGARCMDIRMAAVYGAESSAMSVGRVMLSFPTKLLGGFARRMVRRYLVRDFSPILPLFVCGMALLLGGSLWGAYHWWRSAETGVVASAGTVMLAVLPMFSGLQMLLQALVLDVENGRALSVPEVSYRRERHGCHGT